MNEKDDILLEYLESIFPSAEPPKVLHYNIKSRSLGDWSIDTTRRRLEKLYSLALVEIPYERGKYYKLTQNGQAYLRGDLDASDLNE